MSKVNKDGNFEYMLQQLIENHDGLMLILGLEGISPEEASHIMLKGFLEELKY